MIFHNCRFERRCEQIHGFRSPNGSRSAGKAGKSRPAHPRPAHPDGGGGAGMGGRALQGMLPQW